MMRLLRKLLPRSVLRAYHFAFAYVAACRYGFPSRRLMVIGITGTHGKSSAVMLLGHTLRNLGVTVGWTSTATFSLGDGEELNALKMTMPGRFAIQRMLRGMVDRGCTHAIVETTSEGIVQHRSAGIAYDVAVLMNLATEHVEAHGGFAQYRAAKARLFAQTARVSGKRRVAVVPADLEHPEEFTAHPFREVRTFRAEDVHGVPFAPVVHAFPENAAAVLVLGEVLGFPRSDAVTALQKIAALPGRLEMLEEGQPFVVIVDYAHTPHAIDALYQTLAPVSGCTFHVLGGVGGGRDRWKRPAMGERAAAHADVVIVTNEDPYDDDPMEIMEAVAAGARAWCVAHPSGILEERVRIIPDRRSAFAAVLAEARAGDRVLVTGKGCEQAIVGPGGRKIVWDDRVVLRELLRSA
ncbi:hypothetical protein HY632_02360 [Candidatus Uhrbacteria bacterium]|nr:hypothetical protein [Candidatus Uhrbacteria bacterium]